MKQKRKIEIFSAGCSPCVETIETVNEIACSSCEIEILDIDETEVSAKAKEYGIRSVSGDRLWTRRSPIAARVVVLTKKH